VRGPYVTDAVAALDAAFNEVAKQIVGWTLATL
jgi:ABC-type uncharacterized transport system auxiliary subunit